MPQRRNNSNVLKKEEAKIGASPFVVDLKQKLQPVEKEKTVKEKIKEKLSFARAAYGKLADLNIRKSILGGIGLIKKKAGNYFSFSFGKINELAVASLFKFVIFFMRAFGKIFYKFCYALGWLTVFLFRFILIIFSPLIKLFTKYCAVFYLAIKEFVSRDGRVLSAWGNKEAPQIAPFNTDEIAAAEEDAHIDGGIVPRSSALWRQAFAFAAMLLFFTVPFKAFTYYKSLNLGAVQEKVSEAGGAAMEKFLVGAKLAADFDFAGAQENFGRAGENFLQAQKEIAGINDFLFALASVIPDENTRLASQANHILSAGKIASELGQNLSLAMNYLFNKENKGGAADILSGFTANGKKAITDARKLKLELHKIDADELPPSYREQFLAAREKTDFLIRGLEEFVDLTEKAGILLGQAGDKRYLLIFQNNAEMRGSGGFVGSYALVDFKDGKIKNIEAPGGGSYDTRAGLKEMLLPPEPFYLLGTRWRFWDANWWPDWPKSAKKLAWFYEKSDGPTVDGVIGITTTAAERFLEAIGPIDMREKYGITLTAENFWSVVQEIVEEKKTGAKEPKQIIGDLLVKIMEEMPSRLDKENLIGLIKTAESSLSEKHILFYFTDSELQKKAEAMGWDGRMRQAPKDYLAVINTNIGGGKSDRKIKENIFHEARVMPDGSIINTARIERTHLGVKNEPYVGVRNVDWMRVYVPLGSELIETGGWEKIDDIYFKKPEDGWTKDPEVAAAENSAATDEKTGMKIYNEGSYTVFANWSLVDPGETAVVYLKYKLPFKIEKQDAGHTNIFAAARKKIMGLLGDEDGLSSYSLLMQKQAGAQPDAITSKLKLPDGFQSVWHYGEEMTALDNGWQISDNLNRDKFWATIIKF